MSQAMPQFQLLRPTTVEDAITALQAIPDARPYAGGTDLMVNLRRGLVETPALVDIGGIDELRGITVTDEGLRIGAGTTLRELAEHGDVAATWPAIPEAAIAIAGPGHREAATVGGNLCLDTRCLYYNQSHWWRKSNDFCLKYRGDICHVAPRGNRCRAAFSGDLAPALMVLGATVEIVGPQGRRHIPLPDLYREDGADFLTLDPGELICAVLVPPTGAASAYAKIRVRGSIDFPLAGVAVACETRGQTRHFTLAVTGTNSKPLMICDIPALTPEHDPETYFADLSKLVQKQVSPQRISTVAPHYRRLAVSAMACRLARGLM